MMPPGKNQVSPSLADMIKLGLWRMPFAVGWNSYRAFRSIVASIRIIHDDVVANDKDLKDGYYYTLEVLGIRKDLQRKGIGSEMILHFLNRADEVNIPIYTYTPNQENLSFFTRLGFKVIDERDLAYGLAKIKVFSLKRLTPVNCSDGESD
mmetsp:Transcript_12421/g.18642  ORF Transcript_12421/g.18642 Transcript_12421/m.18642 type:complete len:151 (+) Transcript_12421:310-762(+)|eukprot:CAMPEP_0171453076 /NCGR_PEP_ID=MMETSP0945-20130129/934_1 /TAXON_ID=109269 /ORGANISM="Vaucheria litorea, Strain CCMP2940" /LENGTH=150 /DNA_ID=CAMNT_0011977881 /DNA_START=305 /DNA_END=757 /DNA_ORIENTATION=-